MPVYKDKKRDTWFVKINTRDSVTGKYKQVLKRGFETRRDAILWENEQIISEAKTTSATFGQMMQSALKANDTSPETAHKKTTMLQTYFPLYNEPIEKIKKEDLIAWRSDLADTDLSVRSKNFAIQYLKSVFRFANEIYNIPNISVILKPFKMTKADKPVIEVWTPEEFNRFLAAVELPEYALFFRFLYWTGCRRGEAIALQITDVNGSQVHIHQSMKHKKNGFTPLKTDSSERTITIDHELLHDLQPNIDSGLPFLFGGETPLPISGIQRQFTKAIKESGVKPIRVHDLRHSHATFLINNGANIVAVSKRLGHATINQTLETYAHLFKETDAQLIEIIDKFVSKSYHA